MTEQESADRGDRAARELELTNAAFDQLRETMIEELIGAPIGSAKVGNLHVALQTIEGVRKSLMQMVLNGQVARHAIAAESTLLRPN